MNKAVGTSRASRSYLDAFREIVLRIEKSLKTSGVKLAEPVKMYVAGGAALHFYTGARISEDVDATFSRRLLLPEDLEVTYRDADGSPRLLYFDRQYNDAFGLLHESADRDARPLRLPGVDAGVIEVRLLSPVDLAVSKLARFETRDQEDIGELAETGLLDVKAFRSRAAEALANYVGPRQRIELSIKIACGIIEERAPRSRRAPRKGRATR